MDMKSPKHILENPDGTTRDFQDVSIEALGAHVLFGDVNAQSMREATTFVLKANQIFNAGREITIFLNTLGGDCYDGFAFIDVMEISRNPIKIVGLGNIVSMGVLILAAGHKGRRIMTRNTQVMAHQFSSGVSGKFHEIMADFRAELYLRKQFIEHFKRHSTMDEKTIEEVLFGASDRWLTPKECKSYGLVDHIVDELPEFSLELPSPSLGARKLPLSGSKTPTRSRKSGTEPQTTRRHP
jgi:ATP-dependent Clp protease protease subunit